MELYNLVETRNFLKKFLNDDVNFLGYEQCFNRVPEKIRTDHLVFKSMLPLIENLKVQNNNLTDYIKKTIMDLNNQIESLTKDYHKSGYQFKVKDEVIIHSPFGGVLAENKKKMEVQEDILEDIKVIIQSKSEWNYPSLEIGCGNNDISRCMPIGDPYYVTDMHKETLESLKNTFNEIYKRKVRCYLNSDLENYTNFSFLPQEQFKFILSWNVLNYYPKLEFKQFLSSCWNLLRPGGSMVFSYNDCDYKECVRKFYFGSSWMNESMIREILKEVGLIIKNIHHSTESIHWVECEKPGDLSSVKMSPSIGRIII